MSAAKVLVVDDDELVLASAALILSRAGFDVEQASSLAGFAERVGVFRPRVILLDVHMEGPADSMVRALDALDALWNTHAKIVLHSGLPTHELVARARRIGAAGVLEKPATQDELVACVTQHAV